MRDDDNRATKPYKTYKSGRARRTSADQELAGTRQPRERKPRAVKPETASGRNGGGQPESDAGGHDRYRRYEGTAARGAPDRTDEGRAVPSSDAASKQRRRFRWWQVLVVLLLVLVVAAVVATVLAWPGYKTLDRAVTKANHRLGNGARAELTPDAGWIVRKPTTILLLGVDSKAGEPGRSDTIMLMRFNPGARTVNQLSIPRDTRVDIPGVGATKINEAMFYGQLNGHGPKLALQTVKQFLGTPINHVMIVNFKGFPRLVNAVGGVDLYVPETISTTAGSSQRVVTYEKGWHHFDGKNAMLYVRIRKVDSDFMRARRQQQFLQALQKKIAQPSNITKIPDIGKRFMSGVTTDLTTNQIMQLAFVKWRAKGGSKQVMAGTPTYVGGVAYVLPPSEAEQQKMIRRFLGE
jgi:polyisoprenyl-teichoic acid--peptidoglycan teichoic acid transferase